MKRSTIIYPLLALSIAILACQVLSTADPTPLPTYTPPPTYTPYPTLTPESQSAGAGGFPFALTIKTFSETDEIEDACGEALGSEWRLADWLDIQDFYQTEGSLDAFIAALEGHTSFMLSFEGERWYSEQRHYFGEVHEHDLPDGWLSHADIDEHYIDLGSWSGLDAPLLCFLGEERVQAEDQEADSSEANTTPETPPTFELSFYGTQPCGEWPNYAVFEVESTSIWILQSSFIEIFDNTNNQSVYSGGNDRPFLKEGNCPPGDTILPPFNTRFIAANIKEPEQGTEFEAAITLCTEDSQEGECVTEITSFVFDDQAVGESELPFVGIWKNSIVSLEFTETELIHRFPYEDGLREIFYEIISYDVGAKHIDLLKNRVLQGGQEVDFDLPAERFLSYTITGDEMQMFIGPNPYPNAGGGQKYTRVDEGSQPAGEPSFELEFAGTHPCGNWPNYAAFWVENTSQQTFESVSLNIRDITNDTNVYGGSNDRGFVEEGGCPPGDSTLPPNSTAQVAANIREPEPGTELEATIKLCTQDDLEGECVWHKVKFTFEE